MTHPTVSVVVEMAAAEVAAAAAPARAVEAAAVRTVPAAVEGAVRPPLRAHRAAVNQAAAEAVSRLVVEAAEVAVVAVHLPRVAAVHLLVVEAVNLLPAVVANPAAARNFAPQAEAVANRATQRPIGRQFSNSLVGWPQRSSPAAECNHVRPTVVAAIAAAAMPAVEQPIGSSSQQSFFRGPNSDGRGDSNRDGDRGDRGVATVIAMYATVTEVTATAIAVYAMVIVATGRRP